MVQDKKLGKEDFGEARHAARLEAQQADAPGRGQDARLLDTAVRRARGPRGDKGLHQNRRADDDGGL